MTHRLVLPWPPALNRYYRSVTIAGRARVLISRDGRKYQTDVAEACLIQRAPRGLGARLSVCIAAYPPDRRRRDLDGMLKALLDAITKAGVWADDSQIDSLGITRSPVKAGGQVVVEISAIGMVPGDLFTIEGVTNRDGSLKRLVAA